MRIGSPTPAFSDPAPMRVSAAIIVSRVLFIVFKIERRSSDCYPSSGFNYSLEVAAISGHCLGMRMRVMFRDIPDSSNRLRLRRSCGL